MATIAFLVLPNTSCLNQGLKLAADLKTKGHKVHYLGLEDSEDYIISNEFDFTSLFREHFPKGFFSEFMRINTLPMGLERLQRRWGFAQRMKAYMDHLINGGGEDFLGTLRKLAPDLMIFASEDSPLEWLALLAQSIGVKGIYFLDTLCACEALGMPPVWTNLIPTNSLSSRIRIYIAWKQSAIRGVVITKDVPAFWYR